MGGSIASWASTNGVYSVHLGRSPGMTQLNIKPRLALDHAFPDLYFLSQVDALTYSKLTLSIRDGESRIDQVNHFMKEWTRF